MTNSQMLATDWRVEALASDRLRPWPYRLCRAALFCGLFSVIFAPEFPRDLAESGSALYTRLVGRFRAIDLLILSLALMHVLAIASLRSMGVRFPRALRIPALGFLACIATAIIHGMRHGGTNFFFDWRGLVLGILLYFVWSAWLQAPGDATAAGGVFLAYVGLRLALLYGPYFLGEPDKLGDVTIPTFDGPVLSCAVFATLLAFTSLGDCKGIRRLPYAVLASAACVMVVICLRRTYWGELAIGGAILIAVKARNRLRTLAVSLIVPAVAAAALGSSFSGRVLSLDLTRDDSQFSADNADHLYDLADAWYQVRQSPVLGIGLGTSYPTWEIRHWKPESVMVHNAPLHVWLKYGAAGLVCYLWFHLALLRWLWRKSRTAEGRSKAFLTAAFAYLCAQFVMTLGFAPWPYSELQMTTLFSFIIAAAAAQSSGGAPNNITVEAHASSIEGARSYASRTYCSRRGAPLGAPTAAHQFRL